MDNQFNTLIRSYHDNYLEYKITGTSSYQKAYQTAQIDIEKILSDMQKKNSDEQKNISDFYNQNTNDQIRDVKAKKTEAQHKILSENDQLVSAEMRLTEPNELALGSINYKYIALAVMLLGLKIL